MAIKFLVVDDSLTMRRIVVNALKSIGYDTVVEAADGKEAFDKLQKDPVDFVITDWNMPEMSGLELVRTIRASSAFAEMPVLMVTTRGNKEDVIEALQAKVNNYIVKPFTPQALKEKLDQILKVVPVGK
jgi:two-component system, chemotaxis family, chemotaxis protein CheY